jgi:hypothetical protein
LNAVTNSTANLMKVSCPLQEVLAIGEDVLAGAQARKEIEMRPYVICHMLSSVDGKIDSAALKAVTGNGEYEATGAKLQGDAWICGRTTKEYGHPSKMQRTMGVHVFSARCRNY